MFSGINQSSMFSNFKFSNYWESLANTGANKSSSDTASAAENKDSQELSAREAFVNALKEKGMSEDKIASLPESFWKKAEKKSEGNDSFNFAQDKILQKLADFLARKSDLVKSEQSDSQSSGDSATISQEAIDAAANAAEETDETEETEEESGVVTTETEEEAAEGAQQFASIFDEFKDKLNEILLNGIGLGNLSEAQAGTSMMSYSASFEISYHSMVAVAGENGMTMQETSFSLKGSFEFMGIGSFVRDDSFNPFDMFSDKAQNSDDAEEVDANNPFASLQEYFSPEKTADRILDFSLGFFGNSQQFKEGGNTEESRQSFADVIGAAIQKGFDQALGLLGKLPDNTQEEVDETHTRVFDGLDKFVKTGSKDGSEVNEPLFDFSAYSSVFEMNYSSVTAYYSPEETGQALDDLYNKYFNNSYGSQQVEQSQGEEEQQKDTQQTQASPINVTA